MIGTRIRKIRESKGVTRFDLAEKLGIDETTLGKIETDKIEVNAERIVKLSESLEVPISEFFSGLAHVNFHLETNNHIAFINTFVESQKVTNEKQNQIIEQLLEQNNILLKKIIKDIDEKSESEG